MILLLICRPLAYASSRDNFDLVARYYNLDKELLQGDKRLFSQFKTAYVEKKKQLHKSLKHCTETASMKWSQSSPRSWPIWPLSLQHPCSAERSFSRLRRLKIYLRSTKEQKRLNSHAIVCIDRYYGNKVIVNSLLWLPDRLTCW